MQHTYTPTADGLSHARAREGSGYPKATGTAPAFTYGRSETVGQTTVTARYFHDGWNRGAEYSGQDLSTTYTWGLDLSGTMQGAGGVGGLLAVRQGGVSYYPTFDGNGNISEYLGGNGIAVAHFEYDPFGNLVVDSFDNAANFPYRFSTKPQDMISGWYYYGYRWYDPLTGRWPSRDPIEEGGGLNLYEFVRDDGVNRWDFLGMAFFHLSFDEVHEDLDPNAEKEIYPGGPIRRNPGNSLGTMLIKYDITARCTCVDKGGNYQRWILESLYVSVYGHISIPKSFPAGEEQKEWAIEHQYEHAEAMKSVFRERWEQVEKILDALEAALQRDIQNAKTRFPTQDECEDAARKAVVRVLLPYARLAAARSQNVDEKRAQRHNWQRYKKNLEKKRKK